MQMRNPSIGALCPFGKRRWDPIIPKSPKVLKISPTILALKSKEVNVDLLYMRALTIRKKVYGPENPIVAQSFNDLGVAYGEERKFSEAEQAYSNALTILTKQPN